MKLGELSHLVGYPAPCGELCNIEITRVVSSSEEADQGALFFARDGKRFQIAETIKKAVARGCRAVLTSGTASLSESICLLQSKNASKIALEVEKHLYFEVLRDIEFIFVTGTKGKTTVAKMVAHILNKSGLPCACCGTMGFDFADIHVTLQNTTPDIFTLLPCLELAKRSGARACVLEVSSQALKTGRVDGILGKYGIFTGISADHIDSEEHSDFASYREAKRRLFSDFGVKIAFSPRTVSLAPFMISGVDETLYVDTKAPSDLTLSILEMSKSDISYTDGTHCDTLSLCGEYQLQNAALALLCCSRILSTPPHFLFPVLRDFAIEGRGERILCSGREVIIDYAHNGESVEMLSKNFRSLCEGRMIAVCGGVGDKARGRRMALSRALEDGFDFVILTEDDTVAEERESVMEALYSPIRQKEKIRVIPDRTEAILYALRSSQRGDMIFLLGKGHERFLLRKGVRIPFVEREIVRSYFEESTE